VNDDKLRAWCKIQASWGGVEMERGRYILAILAERDLLRTKVGKLKVELSEFEVAWKSMLEE
jgi:hypothetical protein